MFDDTNFQKFRIFALGRGVKCYKFAYVENKNDVIDYNGKLWEIGEVPNATNQLIKFTAERNFLAYPNGPIIALLHDLIKFQGRKVPSSRGWLITDVGLADLSITPGSRTIQFSSLLPHITAHDKIWINNLVMEGSPTYFIKLFNAKLWFSFFIMFALIGVLSAIGISLLKKVTKDKMDHFAWFSIMVNQGANENSKSISRRLLLISLAIVTIMFHGAFEAFMSSSLAFRHPDLPFSDITTLLNVATYTVCTLYETAAYDQIFYDAKQLARPAKINTDECPNIFHSYDGSTSSIKNSGRTCPGTNMAYVGQGMCFLPDMTANCPMSTIRGKYFNEYASLLMFPGFKYYEQFNRGILRLRSSGHLDYIVKKFDLRQLHVTCRKRFIAPEPDIEVTFIQIRLLLVGLLVGFACCGILLLFELIYKKLCNVNQIN